MRTEKQKQEILKLYHKAIETVLENTGVKEWRSGKVIPLTEGVINNHKVKIWLKNDMDVVQLWIFEEGETGSQMLMNRKYWGYKLARHHPVHGWYISASEKTYLDWNFTVRKEFGL